jgi:hypothetical protein
MIRIGVEAELIEPRRQVGNTVGAGRIGHHDLLTLKGGRHGGDDHVGHGLLRRYVHHAPGEHAGSELRPGRTWAHQLQDEPYDEQTPGRNSCRWRSPRRRLTLCWVTRRSGAFSPLETF